MRRWLLPIVWLVLALAQDARAQSLESALMPGPVIAGHANLEGDCTNCHVRFNRAAQDRLCMDCHKPVGADVRDRRGFHGRLDAATCRSCHTDHRGREVRIAPLDERSFDHAKTDFVLAGAHAKAACKSCHVPGKRHAEAPGQCVDCHRKDDTHRGALGARCADCHGEASWKDTRFDHAKTRFALAGRHADAECRACHGNATFKSAPTTCIGCHRGDDKIHRGRLGDRCDTCHGVRDWKTTTFQHDRDTRYPLYGRHRNARCESCHVAAGGREKPPTTCVACHRTDDKHQGSLGSGCANCHVERGWKETRVDHDATAFPLRDRHRGVECKECHRDPRSYKGTPVECAACHGKDDTHKGRYGEKCEGCHAARSWRDLVFRHDRDTRYPLAGRHSAVKCDSCHTGSLYRDKLATDCRSCHRKDDVHRETLGDRCETCHAEASWKVARFDHARTRFALAGQHARIECNACHRSLLFREAPRECAGCHDADDRHRGTLGRDCAACHTETSWKVARFDHARTRFALAGRHAQIECNACHKSQVYREAPRECVGCHAAEDKHRGTLGRDCAACHNARDWRLHEFDHRRTSFLLDGAHAALDCGACHVAPGAIVAKLSGTCVECHRRDDIHHASFGPLCERCHLTSSFKDIRMPGAARRPGAEGRPR
ncbi:hypothetical protein BURK1_02520 [Burkholderiales bacterium]|nr:hypothetical protein BURK1_02520 [Burkholderiales bacterium]